MKPICPTQPLKNTLKNPGKLLYPEPLSIKVTPASQNKSQHYHMRLFPPRSYQSTDSQESCTINRLINTLICEYHTSYPPSFQMLEPYSPDPPSPPHKIPLHILSCLYIHILQPSVPPGPFLYAYLLIITEK